MKQRYVIPGLLAAMMLAAPVATAAEKCWRMENLPHDQDFETTESGERKWLGEGMSDRKYAEFIDSMDGPIGRCLIAALHFEGKEYPQDFGKAAEIYFENNIRFCTPNFIHLGAMFKHGLGVAKDGAKAAYWFRATLASSPDLARLMPDLAELIEGVQSETGVMIQADMAAAHVWLERVLDEPPERLYERGLAYLKTGEAGAGFPLADAMLRRAAQAGHERAALTHARLYADCKIGAYAGPPRSYLPRFAKTGHTQAAALLGLYFADHPRKGFFYDYEARDWLGKALAGDLPDGLRAEVEAALALVNARFEIKDRRRSQ